MGAKIIYQDSNLVVEFTNKEVIYSFDEGIINIPNETHIQELFGILNGACKQSLMLGYDKDGQDQWSPSAIPESDIPVICLEILKLFQVNQSK